jgi:hypothetical protein
LIAGPLTDHLGWQWLFHMLQIFLVTLLILVFFLCPETTYLRERQYNIDQTRDDHLQDLAETEKTARIAQQMPTNNNVSDTENASRTYSKRKTYWRSLAVYTGIYSKDNLLKLVLAPFVTLLNIAALYTCVTSGMLQAWYVGTAITQAFLFSSPPYLLDAAQLGYLSVGPLLGGGLGSLFIAVFSDPIATWASKRNRGI